MIKQKIRKILVPVNGMEYSMAAADIAAYIAKASDAEVILMHVVTNSSESKQHISKHALLRSGLKVLKEVKFRIRRLNIQMRDLVSVAADPTAEIIRELKQNKYDLVLMGVVDRSSENALHLGQTVERIKTEVNIPTGILIFHERSVGTQE